MRNFYIIIITGCKFSCDSGSERIV